MKFDLKNLPEWLYVDGTGRLCVSRQSLYKHLKANLKLKISEKGNMYLFEENIYKPITVREFKAIIKSYIPEEIRIEKDWEAVWKEFSTDKPNVRESQFNANENLVGFLNGVLKLDTGKLEKYNEKILLTRLVNCNYCPNKKLDDAPIFKEYLETLCENNQAHMNFLLEYMGGILSNVRGYRFKKMLLLVGSGNTGKTQIRELTMNLLGEEHCVSIDIKKINDRFGSAQLYGKRLAGSGDMSTIDIDEMNIIKNLTGGDKLNAENKGKDGFTYRYDGFLWFNTNELPHFRGDRGVHVYKRFAIIRCNNVVTSLLVYSFKVSAAATPVETQCVRCDATLGWSGPFLGSVPTPNDSTAEGNYIVDANRDEYHYYIIKCPDFRSTLLGKKHDNYPASEKHNYTSTYAQYDSSKHTRTYTCTKNNAAYNIVGTVGCGYTKDVLEAHTTSWQRRAAATDEHHVVQQMCICGYVISSAPEEHTFEEAKYYHYNINQHHITKFCTVCQDTINIYENHKFSYSAWTNSSASQCKRTKTCSDCGYSATEYQSHTFDNAKYSQNTNGTHIESKSCTSCGYLYSNAVAHSFTIGDWYRYGTDDENWETYDEMNYHKRDCICDKCGYSKSEYETHDFVIDENWYDLNEIYHYRKEVCTVCTHGNAYYYFHKYPEEKFVYNSLNSNTHQITKTCADCTRTTTEVKSHNFVASEWTKIDGSEPNAGTYDSNKYHKRTLTCSDCGYVKYEYVEHKMQIDGYTSQNADRHSCTLKCSDCTYSYNLNEPHTFNPKDYKYEVIDKDRHLFIKPCDKCSYVYEAREYHEDLDSDCYCDDCGYLMTKFSVTVPTTMVLTMGTDGEVYAPSDVVIINNSTAAVSVKKADINSRNGWNIVPYSTNMANEKVDAKKIGFKMNGIQTDSSGTTDSLSYNNSWIIEKDTSSAVIYDAVVSATSTPIDEQVIEIVYIVDWKE